MSVRVETGSPVTVSLIPRLPGARPLHLTPAGGAVRIGRAPGCDLVLAHPSVSRGHCEVAPVGEAWEVRDLGSANGTWVGSRRVDGPRRLRPGVALRVGEVEVRFDAPRSSRGTRLRRLVARPGARRLGLLAAALSLAVGLFGGARGSSVEAATPGSRSLAEAVAGPLGRGEAAGGRDDRVAQFTFEWAEGRVDLALDAWAPVGVSLALQVNGVSSGRVLPGADTWLRGVRLPVPPALLRPGTNVVTLAPLEVEASPPRWAVARVRLERAPPLAPDLASAHASFARAEARWDARAVGLENTWKACEAYRDARDAVAALVPRPVLHREAEARLERCRGVLQTEFEVLWFTATRDARFGRAEAAREALRAIAARFPDPTDPRHQVAQRVLDAS